MTNRVSQISLGTTLQLILMLIIAAGFPAQTMAQTPGGTVISNQASATYSDGSGGSYSTASNTVVVTVSNVAGLTITPDAGSNPTVVAGETAVLYNFTVTNTGNFTNQVRFLASGASVSVVGPGTVTRAVIDVDNSNGINVGDTDINTNAADVLSANMALGVGQIHVLVEVSVNGGATAGQSVQVFLGDTATNSPTFDNQLANTSANEVRTVSAAAVNGLREARGDISATVVNDSMLQLTLTAPAGPVALGSDIPYTWQASNPSARVVSGVTLNASTAVYIIAPIPARTVLKAGQSFPAGTLYTTSPLSTAPLAATWSTTAPVPLSNTTRIAFPMGASLGAGLSTSVITMIVTVNTGIDASIPIDEIGDVFGKNSVGTDINDQSGDVTANNGDGNANFNEGYIAGAGHGVIQQTTLIQVGSVLIGPSGAPNATGPTDQNDDYTNKSVNTGIAGVAPGGNTNALGQLVFGNTVQNTGNASDTFTLDAPTVPAGFTVEVSTNGGGLYTTVSGGGSVTLAIAFGASANIQVRVTEPSGNAILTGFDTVVRATSANTPAAFNRTIDRLYTGFVRLDKTYAVTNGTGVGNATDPVPGAVINYTITYTNVSTSNGGAGCVRLTATNVVINEDGLSAPNNWGTFTTNSGTAADPGGTVVVVSATQYTDTIASLAAGATGTFTFSRTIN